MYIKRENYLNRLIVNNGFWETIPCDVWDWLCCECKPCGREVLYSIGVAVGWQNEARTGDSSVFETAQRFYKEDCHYKNHDAGVDGRIWHPTYGDLWFSFKWKFFGYVIFLGFNFVSLLLVGWKTDWEVFGKLRVWTCEFWKALKERKTAYFCRFRGVFRQNSANSCLFSEL